MRDNWLPNRIFKSFDEIVDHGYDVWKILIDQSWRIMSTWLVKPKRRMLSMVR